LHPILPSGTPTKINGPRKRFLVDGKKKKFLLFLTSANTLPSQILSESYISGGVEGTIIVR
jgi:hypothetical protein